MNNAQPIGGPGTVVQLDEADMHGRRKNHVGRVMHGNCVAPARQNTRLDHRFLAWLLNTQMEIPKFRCFTF